MRGALFVSAVIIETLKAEKEVKWQGVGILVPVICQFRFGSALLEEPLKTAGHKVQASSGQFQKSAASPEEFEVDIWPGL
jgi:hypothetical protein